MNKVCEICGKYCSKSPCYNCRQILEVKHPAAKKLVENLKKDLRGYGLGLSLPKEPGGDYDYESRENKVFGG